MSLQKILDDKLTLQELMISELEEIKITLETREEL